MKYLWLVSLFVLSFSMLYPYSVEKGKATHYHKKFEGKRTASGLKYHSRDLVCAHRKHPFGTELYIVNPLNKKRVKVKVIDRGPFTKGRIIDLSHAAAERIGLLGEGIGLVEIHPVIDSLEYLPLSNLIKIKPLELKK